MKLRNKLGRRKFLRNSATAAAIGAAAQAAEADGTAVQEVAR